MSKRLNAKTRSDMGGKGSSGDGSGEMTAELWGEVYDVMCAKIKTDNVYAKLRAKADEVMCDMIRSRIRQSKDPKKVAPKTKIMKTQKIKTSKPAAAAAAAAITTTTAAAAAADTETKGTSFFKPATPATPAKRRPRKKLSLKISHQEQLIDRTPDVSSAKSVLEQWWEQTPREPTYSPNAPVMMTPGDSDDHEALKLATLPSMDLDTPTLLDASWSPASPEDVLSSGMPMVCDDDDDDDDNVDDDPYGEAQLTPLQRECSTCRHNNMLRYISCNSGQVMCHVCFREVIDCTCLTDGPLTCLMEDHILWA
ncbi:uncharacterized protein [Haliotis cracherodii]|uniref:uncharacterized protein n=1 Tax=Haliotis cracherodii TaxID=6455 RepID=UPI0039EA7842